MDPIDVVEGLVHLQTREKRAAAIKNLTRQLPIWHKSPIFAARQYISATCLGRRSLKGWSLGHSSRMLSDRNKSATSLPLLLPLLLSPPLSLSFSLSLIPTLSLTLTRTHSVHVVGPPPCLFPRPCLRVVSTDCRRLLLLLNTPGHLPSGSSGSLFCAPRCIVRRGKRLDPQARGRG